MKDIDEGLIDVTDLSLDELFALEDKSPLAEMVRRVIAAADDDSGQVSAFNSAI